MKHLTLEIKYSGIDKDQYIFTYWSNDFDGEQHTRRIYTEDYYNNKPESQLFKLLVKILSFGYYGNTVSLSQDKYTRKNVVGIIKPIFDVYDDNRVFNIVDTFKLFALLLTEDRLLK